MLEPENTLKLLVRKSGSIKQRLTLFNKYLMDVVGKIDILEVDKSNINEIILELDCRCEKFKQLLSDYEEVQMEIETICNDSEIDKHFKDRQWFENEYFKNLNKAKTILETFNRSNQQLDSASNASNHSGGGSIGGFSNPQIREVPVKLPLIQLSSFNGTYTKWLEFKDTFESLINTNTSIGDIQKFHYLRASLTGSAKQIIESLEFSSANYSAAWELLCKRYDNRKILVRDHISGIYEMDPLRHESSEGLRHMLDTLNKHLRALENLGEPVKFWDSLLIFHINTKFDKSTLKEWEIFKIKNELPSLEDFKNFIQGRADLLETIESNSKKGKDIQGSHRQKSFLTVDKGQNKGCIMCKAFHSLSRCKRFLDLSIYQRMVQVKRNKLCLCCFDKNHFNADCPADKCSKCGLPHNVLLHYNRDNEKGSAYTSSTPSNNSVQAHEVQSRSSDGCNAVVTLSNTSSKGKGQVLLSTAVVKVKDTGGHWVECVVLLDSESMSNFITEKMCSKLRLPTESINVAVVGISQDSTTITKKCNVHLRSNHDNFEISMSCLVTPQITDELPLFEIEVNNLQIPTDIYLANPDFYRPQEIDMLIGASLFWNLIRGGQIRLGDRLPILQNSCLGWIISGEVGQGNKLNKTWCNLSRNQEVQDQLEKFWLWEEPGGDGMSNELSIDDSECERLFVSNMERSDDGRFVVAIPFRDSVTKLGDSRKMALKRLYALERKLAREENLKKEYCEYMSEYEKVGHMTEVKADIQSKEVSYYLPHHSVIKEDSSTTKLRIVYDGSAKSDSGVSVNDLQYVGQKIQEDLIAILLRFRENSVAFCADIAKMYRQVWVKQEHRQFQRILWRCQPSHEVLEYNLNTVTFGLTSSPFLAIRCLKQLAFECKEQYPEVSSAICRDFYVDDLISGSSSVVKAIKLCEELSKVLGDAGFTLRKFVSNRKELLQEIEGSNETQSSVLNLGENEKTKTLGLYWHCSSDLLSYRVGAVKSNDAVTKRKILSDVAQIFDPLGLLSACVIIPKIMLQRLWQLKISWDDPIPSELTNEWYKFKEEMRWLNEVSFPRYVCCENSTKNEIHGFSDASQYAIGACVYVRSIDRMGNVQVKLLCAKGKVAPIKAITIPKLELSGALLLSKLIKVVQSSLTIPIDSIYMWSDSQVALSWIKSPPNQFQIFVSNRVSQIQTMVGSDNWFYVKSEDNPADLVSRGISPMKLKNSALWFNGPPWLSVNQMLIIPEIDLLDLSNLPEKRKNVVCGKAVEKSPWSLFTRFSSFHKLKRVFAYCLRFITHARKNFGENRKSFELSVEELDNSETVLVYLSQMDSFINELNLLRNDKCIKGGKLSNLSPFIDSNRLLRVGGRLQLSDFDYNKKHPMLLNAKQPLADLIVRAEHVRLMHAGPQMVMGSLREKYWITQGRNLVRKIIHDCVLCAKIKPINLQVKMGNLPKERICQQPPFNTTGVDYMGPFNFKTSQGRGVKIYKGYVCLFVCFVTHAIHLEIVTNLSTEGFIAAFRRFVSRRGKPNSIYSDNGKNFVGASSELRELGQSLISHNLELSKIAGNENVKWVFMPAYSPHFGGLWEAGVKTTKYYLKRAIGNTNLTYEDFSTVLCQVEAIVNSRPLTPLSSSPFDLDALTPAHFLIGKRLTSLPSPSVIEISDNKLSRYQQLQKIQQQFWDQWSKIYVSELQTRTKWKHHQDQLKDGMLVVVKDDSLPPLCWRMARVVKLHPGQDGIARVATLKTMNGLIKRSFAKLCPLPIKID